MLARLIEAEKQQRARLKTELAHEAEALRVYWSDPLHLQAKFRYITGVIQEQKLLPEEQITNLAIQTGTGSVVLRQDDGQYHYLEVDMPQGGAPLYISPATLPEDHISQLFTRETLDALTK